MERKKTGPKKGNIFDKRLLSNIRESLVISSDVSEFINSVAVKLREIVRDEFIVFQKSNPEIRCDEDLLFSPMMAIGFCNDVRLAIGTVIPDLNPLKISDETILRQLVYWRKARANANKRKGKV